MDEKFWAVTVEIRKTFSLELGKRGGVLTDQIWEIMSFEKYESVDCRGRFARLVFLDFEE
jgi:hypothetical protein